MTYSLIRKKRDWIPEWLYRIGCINFPLIGHLALIQPFKWILHDKPIAEDSLDKLEIALNGLFDLGVPTDSEYGDCMYCNTVNGHKESCAWNKLYELYKEVYEIDSQE